jgi:hypothetical protein
MKKQFRDFESAREFARSLNLKNLYRWNDYCKSGNKPDDIPSAPAKEYKKKFKGYGDWLGYKIYRTRLTSYISFTEARDFARSLNLKGQKEWQEYCKSGKRPNNIPFSPSSTYKNEYKGMSDWLGTGRIADQYRVYRPFSEAREFARALELKNEKEWEQYCSSGNKPDDIPKNIRIIYKKDFKGINDWLGTEWRSFTEARDFARALNLKGIKEWKEYCKSGNKPDDIPAAPWNTYKEWKKK